MAATTPSTPPQKPTGSAPAPAYAGAPRRSGLLYALAGIVALAALAAMAIYMFGGRLAMPTGSPGEPRATGSQPSLDAAKAALDEASRSVLEAGADVAGRERPDGRSAADGRGGARAVRHDEPGARSARRAAAPRGGAAARRAASRHAVCRRAQERQPSAQGSRRASRAGRCASAGARPGRQRRAFHPDAGRDGALLEFQPDPSHPMRAAHPRPLLRRLLGHRPRLPDERAPEGLATAPAPRMRRAGVRVTRTDRRARVRSAAPSR